MSTDNSAGTALSRPKKQISTFGGFVAGGIAACGAVTLTNPIEIVKTRYARCSTC